MTKYFLDTEFIDNGETIDLISIGIVSEEGGTYYAVNDCCEFFKASDWVVENVLEPHIGRYERQESGCKEFHFFLDARKCAKTKEQIAQDILEFIPPNSNPEFWADYADYDWVAFCQLFGSMMDLPDGYPMYCRDIRQEIDRIEENYDVKVILPPQDEDEKHHALFDAYWLQNCHAVLPKDIAIRNPNGIVTAKENLVKDVKAHPNYNEPHYLMQFFSFAHLPEGLQMISRPFCELANAIDQASASNNPEKEMALRKLLEAKDCAVRAAIFVY